MEKCKECNGIIVQVVGPYQWTACDILWTWWGNLYKLYKQCFSCKKIIEETI